MRIRCLAVFAVLAATIAPAAAQQQLPRPGQGTPPAPPLQQQLGRQPQAQPAPMQPAPPQAQQPAPGGQQQQQALSPPRPYKPVTVTLPGPHPDQGLANLRKQIAAAAQRKDRAALGRLVAAQGFFWFKGQGDGVDKRKSSLDNLAAAIGLDAKDGSGWETLSGFAADETAEPFADKPGVVCSPAGPQFNEQELEQLTKNTQTDIGEWVYTITDGAEVRAQPSKAAPVIEKLGLQFVRVLFDETQQAQQNDQVTFVRVVTPSGKVGYVSEEDLSPPDLDQVCYLKEANGGWKIIGLVSAGEE